MLCSYRGWKRWQVVGLQVLITRAHNACALQHNHWGLETAEQLTKYRSQHKKNP